MKKTLISLAALTFTVPALAAENCAYSPLQNLIRNVNNANEIVQLINQGVVFDEKVHCGGSLMQLAILRGNSDVLKVLFQQEKSRANATVSLRDFRIEDAPQEIPLILFAAYYAPNGNMISELVNAGADISKVDSSGRNILWYIEQNPVLRNTPLSQKLNEMLLKSLIPTQTAPQFKMEQKTAEQQPQQQQQQTKQEKPTGPSVVDVSADVIY